MANHEDLILGLEFEGVKGCNGSVVGKIDEWWVCSLEIDGIRKFSMLGTSKTYNFEDDHLRTIREFCEKNRFPIPLELASKTMENYVITGLLYPPFQTIREYCKHERSTSEFASILKSLLSELVLLYDAKQYPWKITSSSIVILDGMKGAWFLNPYHTLGGQSHRSKTKDLSSLRNILKKLRNADESDLMFNFLECLEKCLKTDETSLREKRLLKCPLFYSHPNEYWTLIANAYEGLRNSHYKSLLEKMPAQLWQTRLVANCAGKRGEMMGVLYCANETCRTSETFVGLVTYLRHFKQHGNERRLQMQKLIALKNKLNCNLTKSKINNIPYIRTTNDFHVQVGMSVNDPYLQPLLDCINLDYFAPSTESTDPLDWGLFKKIDSLYPNFFGEIFAASFNENVKEVYGGFD